MTDTPARAPLVGSGPFRVRRGDQVVVPRLDRAATAPRRMVGLLGRSGIAQDEGLWIVPTKSIHMFFMRFPIDVVFLDRALQVVRVHEDVRPWRTAGGGKFAHSVLELPQGTAAFHNLRVGDRLVIEPVAR